MGSDATGDMYYRAASTGYLTRLAAGADGYVLTGTGAGSIPAWESPAAGFASSDAHTWTADQTFNDNVKVTLGTGGDADLYYDGTDLVLDPSVVGTGNVVVQVASSGADPNVKGLMVESSSSAAITIGSGTTSEGMLHFADSGEPNSGRIVYDHNANDMYFCTAATERMRIDSTGVGIGTTSPSGALEVIVTPGVPVRITDPSASTTASEPSLGFYGSTDGGTRLGYIGKGSTSNNEFRVVNSQDDDMWFGTNNAERMRIDNGGAVTFNNAGVGWQYVQGFQATTTWTDTNVTMANKAQLIMWLSYNNFNGATEGRQWGIAYCSGNGEGSVNYFRNTINVIGSNSSGWHNYAGISLREKPDSGTSAGRILQVQRSSNSSNGYFLLYKMSVAGSGF